MVLVDQSRGSILRADQSHDSILRINQSRDSILPIDQSCDSILSTDHSHGSVSRVDESHDSILRTDLRRDSIQNVDLSRDSILRVGQSRESNLRVDQSCDSILNVDQSRDSVVPSESRCHSYECDELTAMTEVPALDKIRARAHRLCGEYLRGAWRTVPPHSLIVRKISGGLSNLLYYCQLPPACPPTQGEPACVVLRLYGQTQGEQALQGLIAESVIFTLLSVSQRGPRLYGVVPGGRLEEYIPARPLVTEELADPRLSVQIAEKVAQIHMMEVPIIKEPRWLWETIDRWMTGIEEFIRETPTRDEYKAMIEQVAAYDLQRERDWLKEFLIVIDSRVVFCHNDVQEGNILLRNTNNALLRNENTEPSRPDEANNEANAANKANDAVEANSPKKADCDVAAETSCTAREASTNVEADVANKATDRVEANSPKKAKKADDNVEVECDAREASANVEAPAEATSEANNLVLIDFEYCSYNYRAFDIANHMCEWVYDYSNEEHPYFYAKQDNYPTHTQQERFIRHYLTTVSREKKESLPTEAEVGRLTSQVRAFTLASHFFWGLWSVVNASTSTIHFDYWGYGRERFTRYFQRKAELLQSRASSEQRNAELLQSGGSSEQHKAELLQSGASAEQRNAKLLQSGASSEQL